MRILLAEDDDFLADAVVSALRSSGYSVNRTRSGLDAEHCIVTEPYDVVLLDLGLPQLDGLEVLRRIRRKGAATPVLILTARDNVADRVAGLDGGANDYLVKPFELAELEARIRALTRKEYWSNKLEIAHGELKYDVVGRRATLHGHPLELSARETAVLEILLQRVGRLVSKAQITNCLSEWEEDLTTNAIDIVMHRLRKKLEYSGVNIKTIRGLGYLITKAESSGTANA